MSKTSSQSRPFSPACNGNSSWLSLRAWVALLLGLFLSCIAQAAVTFVASATANAGASGGTTLTITPPVGVAAGDLMLAQVSVRGGTDAAITAPAGWSQIVLDTSTIDIRQAVYYKLASVTETAAYNWTLSSSQRAAIGMLVYRGARTVPPASSTTVSASGASVVATGLTTAAANSVVIGLFSTNLTTSFMPPSGMTERYDNASGAGPNGITIEAAVVTQALAAATGNKIATAAASGVGIGQLIVLEPALLSLGKTASASNMPANTNFTYTLSVSNTSSSTVTGVVVNDNVTGAGLTYVDFSTATGTFVNSGGTLIWTVGDLAANTSATATLTVYGAVAGAAKNTISASASNIADVPTAAGVVNIYAPLADWRMDEASWNGTAGEVKDSTGNGYNGRAAIAAGATAVASTSLTAPVAYTSASRSTCAYGDFDRASGPTRTNTYVELTGIPPLPSSFTFAAWIRTTNAGQSGQRILVRDDAQNGWGFSMGDPGNGKIRLFNRNMSAVGTVTGTGSFGCGINSGTFCLDTSAVITNNNWFFVAVAVDTSAKTVSHYIFNTGGTLLSTTTGSFSGTWTDGTGLASLGGETSSSSEGRNAAFHFKGNIDEVQIYNGVLSQSDLDLLRTRSRTCAGSGPDHVELVHSGAALTCAPKAIKVLGCTTATSCSSTVADQYVGSVTFTPTPISGAQWCADALCATPLAGAVTLASGSSVYLREPTARTDTMAGTVTGALTPALQCYNTTTSTLGTSAAACNVVFASAGFLVSAPNHTSCTPQSVTVQALQSSPTGAACVPAFQNVSRTVNLYSGYTNPTTGTLKASFTYPNSASTSASVAALSTTAGAPTALTNLYFDNAGIATLTNFSYPDVGQVALYPTYTGVVGTAEEGRTLVAFSGNTFIAAPASFAFSGIPPEPVVAPLTAPLTAGNAFNVTLTAQNACTTPTPTPNFGKETSPATVALTSTNPQPGAGNSTAISQTVSGFGATTDGQASTNVTWKEVGTVDLVATSTNYLGSGLSPSSTQAAVGRFKPAYFDTTVTTPGCATPPYFTYSDQPFTEVTVTAKATGNTTTANYAGAVWAKDVTLSDANAGTGIWTNNTLTAASFVLGEGKSTTATYRFANKITAPYTLKLRATEPPGLNGVSSSTGTEAVRQIVSGRVYLLNAYGSEKLALPLVARLEYFDTTPTAGWRQATSSYVDTCTKIAATNFAFTTAPACAAAVTSCITALSVNGSDSVAAAVPWAVSLLKPTAAGSACITLNLDGAAAGARCTATGAPGATAATAAAPWLKYGWSSATATNPTARATFGIFKSPLIYRRENY